MVGVHDDGAPQTAHLRREDAALGKTVEFDRDGAFADAGENERAVGGRQGLTHHIDLTGHHIGIELGDVGLREGIVEFRENRRRGKKAGRELVGNVDASGARVGGRFHRARQQGRHEALDIAELKQPQAGHGRFGALDLTAVQRDAHFALTEGMHQKRGAVGIELTEIKNPVGGLLGFKGLEKDLFHVREHLQGGLGGVAFGRTVQIGAVPAGLALKFQLHHEGESFPIQ